MRTRKRPLQNQRRSRFCSGSDGPLRFRSDSEGRARLRLQEGEEECDDGGTECGQAEVAENLLDA